MTDTSDYLASFHRFATEVGLELKRPGANWVAMPDLVSGSHISLSVRSDQIQVNLNNEQDADRQRFDELYKDRLAIADAVGQPLSWEKKEGRKKTAVRATYSAGLADRADWRRQHEWAHQTMRKFEREFGGRLRAGAIRAANDERP